MPTRPSGGARARSKVVKPSQRSRGSTTSTNQHRFQSFSERIARIKIDPIRRRRNIAGHEDAASDDATYFGKHLDEWRDLNLSQTFTSFAKEAVRLCDNLPMVLYNEEAIVNLLITYIEKNDALALEPLLSLLSHFAHDLDTRFERHFQRAVIAVMQVAAKHEDPAVVEWCFTCLAWLFKYLSRLLVPDLRPLYDLMSPYLGKEVQKPYIVRFSAESLSFLIRKSAAVYDKDPTPLDTIIGHIFNDCVNTTSGFTGNVQLQGLMTLLTDAIKSVQGEIHSSGLAILRSCLRQADQRLKQQFEVVLELISGVLTSLIHHTDSNTFGPIEALVIESCISHVSSLYSTGVNFSAQLIFTITAVRKGSRITDWASIISILQKQALALQSLAETEPQAAISIVSALGVVLQEAPVETVVTNWHVYEILQVEPWTKYFLPFCDFVARLGRGRFEQLLLPLFYKFVSRHAGGSEDDIGRLVANFANLGIHPRMQCSEDMQRQLIGKLIALRREPVQTRKELTQASLALKTLQSCQLTKEYQALMHDELKDLVTGALERNSIETGVLEDFSLGPGLEAIITYYDNSQELQTLLPRLCTESDRFLSHPAFWSNLANLTTSREVNTSHIEKTALEPLLKSLLQALTMPSHQIRRSALIVLQSLYKHKGQSVPLLLETAMRIETTPISLETSRGLSMEIRKLGSEAFQALENEEFLQKSLISYCFGILHFQLSQAWDDATNALAEMSKSPVGDETVTSIIRTWLESIDNNLEAPEEETSPFLCMESPGFRVESDFECSNLRKVSAIKAQSFCSQGFANFQLSQQAPNECMRISVKSNHLREQALRILNKIPKLAEKRSRMLVPILLRWAKHTQEEDGDSTLNQKLSRKHQKALLAVFAQFTNPKVLYLSSDVYSALLRLCAHGDVEIQRSALASILAWKTHSINKYEEHLKNLLDESRFRDEISVFLQSRGDDGLLDHPEDHPELMPVLLRLLYGRAITGGQQAQGSRRRAIFSALSGFKDNVIEMFVDIILSRAESSLGAEVLDQTSASSFSWSLRQQAGMMNMVDDMLHTMGPALEPYQAKLLESVLTCTIRAARQLDANTANAIAPGNSLLRSIRQTGLHILIQMFSTFSETDFTASIAHIVKELITPRLKNFATEQMQSVSTVLRLLSTWSASTVTSRYLVDYDGDILDRISDLLSTPNAKDEVRLFILRDIVDNLLRDKQSNLLDERLIISFVRSIGSILKQQPSSELLQACVRTFSFLASGIQSPQEAQEVVFVCTSLLTKPNKEVLPKTKSGLLETILPLVNNFEVVLDDTLYNALCSLSSRLNQSETRVLLCEVLLSLCKSSPELSRSAEICAVLNAVEKLGEPDHARREQGFIEIFEHHASFTVVQWQPIVHNCLYYLRDADDMVARSSASQVLRRFISCASRSVGEYKILIEQVLLPGLEHGMKESSELVRAEYLNVLGFLVETISELSYLSQMTVLTMEGDEEASFFHNVLHIQQHRRLRALRRLADSIEGLSSNVITKIFLPLLEHYVFDPATNDAGRTLSDQAILTIGALATKLSWSSFRSTFKRYCGMLHSADDMEKPILRLLSALSDAVKSSKADCVEPSILSERQGRIINEFLPPLMKYLHQKDESTVDRRLGVAVTIVKFLLVLPEDEMSARLTPVLTDICQVLRSRAVEARDQTRKTLSAIMSFIKPSYFGFIVKELRSALQRGYQLHVLSFTIHSLLVHAVDGLKPGDLDHCLHDLTLVIMDDIFGIVGQEKDAEEYKTGMKEVKSSKSYDTMELLAKITPVRQLGQLVRPIQALLQEKLESSRLRKIDDLLIRVRRGVDHNPDAENRDMLIFCHEMVRQLYATGSSASSNRSSTLLPNSGDDSQKTDRDKAGRKIKPNASRFKLVSFAFDLTRKVLRRHDSLMTPTNLHAFLPIIGDALVEGHEEVRIASIKLLSTIMRLPMPEFETNGPVYIQESVALIKAATSINSDSAKAALELITAVLREKRSVPISDKSVAAVLKVIKSDMDEPSRQGIIYKFIRAVLSRKIMATEVYEIMDEITQVLVTNPDRTVRESARSVYIQFVLNYPQSKDRWNKQIAFIVQNLKYEHASGRQSVMELSHQLLLNLGDEVLERLSLTLFVALVPVQISDADLSCRQMAGILIGKLVERASPATSETLITLANKWLRNEDNLQIKVAALNSWQIILRTALPTKRLVDNLRQDLESILDNDLTSTETDDGALNEKVLRTFKVITETLPEVAFAADAAPIWSKVENMIAISNLKIKHAVTELVEILLSDMARTSAKTVGDLSSLPLRGSQGLALEAMQLRSICLRCLRALQTDSEEFSEHLADKVVRILMYLGRCFNANGMHWTTGDHNASKEDEEEEDESASAKDASAFGYLFNRLSYIIRQENFTVTSRAAALKCQASLVHQASTIPHAGSVVRSLYLLTDPSIPRQPGEAQQALADSARELLEEIQKKIGSDSYLSLLGAARSAVHTKREDRRQKRRIDAVSAPERWALMKKRKHENQKAKLKAKAAEARGRRRAW